MSSDEVDNLPPDEPLLPSDHRISRDSYGASHNDDRGRQGGRFVWALTLSAGLSGVLFGYDTGVISATLVSIGSDLSNRPLTTLDKSLVTSCTSLFALLASPIAGVMADIFGRRKVILAADVLFILGALLQAFTGTVWIMIAGRSVIGLAIGCASLVAPLYISELAPSYIRGRLVTVSCLFITGGQVIAYVAGWLLSPIHDGWRWMVGLGTVPGLFQFAAFAVLPETPRWLLRVGDESNAQKVLTKIYEDSAERDFIVKRIYLDIKQEIGEEETSHVGELGNRVQRVLGTLKQALDLLQIGGNRRALIIAMMLQGLQQLCGFNSLMYFSATIFSMLSFSSPTLTALSIAMTNFIFTLLALVLIDRIGRRYILLYSIPVMALSLVVCAFAFPALGELSGTPAGPPEKDQFSGPIVILFSLTIYTAAYALGLGNVAWHQSELFTLRARSIGSGLATATNWGSNFIVGLTFLPMLEWLTPSWTFALYAIICAAGWAGVWAIYPEMSGLGLEEVKALFQHGWGVQESLQRRR